MTSIRDVRNWLRSAKSSRQVNNGSAAPKRSLEVALYTRPNCSLCSVAKEVILRVREEIPFTFREIDISDDPVLEDRFGTDIPVVFVCGRRAFKYRVDENRLRKSLRARGRAG